LPQVWMVFHWLLLLNFLFFSAPYQDFKSWRVSAFPPRPFSALHSCYLEISFTADILLTLLCMLPWAKNYLLSSKTPIKLPRRLCMVSIPPQHTTSSALRCSWKKSVRQFWPFPLPYPEI
jgi:hypothetical protein